MGEQLEPAPGMKLESLIRSAYKPLLQAELGHL